MFKFKAIGVSEGLAHAKALVIKEADLTVVKDTITDAAAEQQRVLDAVEKAKKQIELLRDEAEKNIGAAEAEIFDAHLLMLDDPDFVEGMTNLIADEMVCAEYACFVNCENFQAMFRAMDDEYMQARAADIGDISQRVLKNLKGIADNAIDTITEPCIIIANDLTPSDTAKIGSKPVVASSLALAAAPAIRQSWRARWAFRRWPAQAIRWTASRTAPTCCSTAQPVKSSLIRMRIRWLSSRQRRRQRMSARPCSPSSRTAKARRATAAALSSKATSASRTTLSAWQSLAAKALACSARSFLFMDRDDLPSEDEQFEAYKQACEAMAGKPVIIRTLDIGGDKEVPALGLEKEQNPFLGYRAIRICLNQTDLFLTQLRALLRAAQYGDLRIMFPMISSIEEIRHAKQILQQAMDLLEAEKIPFNPHVKVGIMVEIPVAAVCADVLAKEVDFFSIGTNDLIQYSCAVDRINEKISYLYRPLHPGVLRLIAMTAKAANENGIEVGVCGEMAGTPGMAPVLCGLGVTNLSMSASAMLAAKADLAAHSYGECKELADKLVAAASATDAEQIFADWRG